MAITPLNPGETWGEHRQKINDNDAELDSRVTQNETDIGTNTADIADHETRITQNETDITDKVSKGGDNMSGALVMSSDTPQIQFNDTDSVDVDGQQWRMVQENNTFVLQRMLADGSWGVVFRIGQGGMMQLEETLVVNSAAGDAIFNIISQVNPSRNYWNIVLDSVNDVIAFQVRGNDGSYLATCCSIELDPTGQIGQINFAGNVPAAYSPIEATHLTNKAYVDNHSMFTGGNTQKVPYLGSTPVDPDTIDQSGYYLITMPTALPGFASETVYLFVLGYADNLLQVAWPYTEGSGAHAPVSTRSRYNGTWSSWTTAAQQTYVEELEQQISTLKNELADLKARLEAAGI